MRLSIITPNYNGAAFLETTIQSVLDQKAQFVELEYIIVDGQSTDSSHDIINRYRNQIDDVIIEQDSGPACAINKGLARASGDVIAWLNADDVYYHDTLMRISDCMKSSHGTPFCFGKCSIIDEQDEETRVAITRFKELFYPVNSRFVYQSINYISQPACFFTKEAYTEVGPLREDMVAAWDYEFFLRLWRLGKGKCLSGPPLAAFRCHSASISSQNFKLQFKEEYEAAKKDSGVFSIQHLLHLLTRWGIVGAYSAMSMVRSKQ